MGVGYEEEAGGVEVAAAAGGAYELGFSFSVAGLLYPYHLGVAHQLKRCFTSGKHVLASEQTASIVLLLFY